MGSQARLLHSCCRLVADNNGRQWLHCMPTGEAKLLPDLQDSRWALEEDEGGIEFLVNDQNDDELLDFLRAHCQGLHR